jgi:hypothetical protein
MRSLQLFSNLREDNTNHLKEYTLLITYLLLSNFEALQPKHLRLPKVDPLKLCTFAPKNPEPACTEQRPSTSG